MVPRKYLMVVIVSILSVFPCIGMNELIKLSAFKDTEEVQKKSYASVPLTTFQNMLQEKNDHEDESIIDDPKSARVQFTVKNGIGPGRDLTISLPFDMGAYSFYWFPRSNTIKYLLTVKLLGKDFSSSLWIDKNTDVVILKKDNKDKIKLVDKSGQDVEDGCWQLRDKQKENS